MNRDADRRAVALVAADLFAALAKTKHDAAIDVRHVQRASQVVHVLLAADAAEDHGRWLLAWRLRRFAARLRR